MEILQIRSVKKRKKGEKKMLETKKKNTSREEERSETVVDLEERSVSVSSLPRSLKCVWVFRCETA